MLAMTLLADHPKEAALGAEPPEPRDWWSRSEVQLLACPGRPGKSNPVDVHHTLDR